jgi:hypothetical protein
MAMDEKTPPKDAVRSRASRAFEKTCAAGGSGADNSRVFRLLIREIEALIDRWKSLLNRHLNEVTFRLESGKLDAQPAILLVLGLPAAFEALVALEAFRRISSNLNSSEKGQLRLNIHPFALAMMAESLADIWHKVRSSEHVKYAGIRRALHLSAEVNLDIYAAEGSHGQSWSREIDSLRREFLDPSRSGKPIGGSSAEASSSMELLLTAENKLGASRDKGLDEALLCALTDMEPLAMLCMMTLLDQANAGKD